VLSNALGRQFKHINRDAAHRHYIAPENALMLGSLNLCIRQILGD
jgi:hypothetical protein